MKVLRVIGLILGILLILGGGGLIAASFVADQGQSAINQEMEKQGLKGPVDGTVIKTQEGYVLVDYTDQDGNQQRAAGPVTTATQPQVGDTVPVYYRADDPTAVVIADIPTEQLGQASDTLRLAGFVTLGVGVVLLIASILGFVLGRKKPAEIPPAAQPYPPATYPGPPPSAPVPRGGMPTEPIVQPAPQPAATMTATADLKTGQWAPASGPATAWESEPAPGGGSAEPSVATPPTYGQQPPVYPAGGNASSAPTQPNPPQGFPYPAQGQPVPAQPYPPQGQPYPPGYGQNQSYPPSPSGQ